MNTPTPAHTTGLLARFIGEQPQAVAAAFAAAADWPGRHRVTGAKDGLILVGSGSSFHAAATARPALARAIPSPVAVAGAEDYLRDFNLLARHHRRVLILSQSGNSITSVAAAKRALAAGLDCLAITMNPEAEIAATGAALLLLPIGDEPIGPKTKGFTATLAALAALAGASAPPTGWLAPLVPSARDAATALAGTMDGVDFIMVCGRGALFGIALEASLKIAEIAGIPSAAFPWEEALHGRLHGLTARSMALFIAATAEDLADAAVAAAAMHRRGVRLGVLNLTGVASADDVWLAPPVAEPWAPVAAVLPFQWLALRLAEARGLVPEAMRYPGLSADLHIKLGPAVAGNQ
jgi:glucosamine--fructose-6-phosphate aminotransferase (isomerizing)